MKNTCVGKAPLLAMVTQVIKAIHVFSFQGFSVAYMKYHSLERSHCLSLPLKVFGASRTLRGAILLEFLQKVNVMHAWKSTPSTSLAVLLHSLPMCWIFSTEITHVLKKAKLWTQRQTFLSVSCMREVPHIAMEQTVIRKGTTGCWVFSNPCLCCEYGWSLGTYHQKEFLQAGTHKCSLTGRTNGKLIFYLLWMPGILFPSISVLPET